jgi:murein tripeptide amidase MpaA
MSKRITMLMVALIATTQIAHSEEDWRTDYEKSQYLATPRYEETVKYCKRLADYSPSVEYRSFGISPQGRELPLLIIDTDGEFDPAKAHQRNKAIVLVQAGIHAGEIEGKDAGLVLLRDMLVNGHDVDLLDSVVVLFIPIFSVDGHERFGAYNRINQNGPTEMGWRATAQNLNLNRDYMKADTPEMRAWLRLFNEWLPDVLTDIHTSDGADFQYAITYVLENHAGIAEPLRSWSVNELLPGLKASLKTAGYELYPYVWAREGSDVRRGLKLEVFPPRFSNGYGAAQNRPFILIETHMLKPYRVRVEATSVYLRNLIGYCNSHSSEIVRIIRSSDSLTAESLAGKYLPLNFELSGDSTMVDFAGMAYHYEKSKISGARSIVWEDKPVNYRLPMFNHNVATDSAVVPFAYLIPKEFEEIISRLRLHGIKVNRLQAPLSAEVSAYHLYSPQWAAEPYESHQPVEFEIVPESRTETFAAGTAVVLLNQRTNRVITRLLEPGSVDSYVRWGFLNAIFEQAEYAEDYVIEKMAPRMLEQDSMLREEFERRLTTDTLFAKSPKARLDFFYSHTPYWDSTIGSYPIRKLPKAIKLSLD